MIGMSVLRKDVLEVFNLLSRLKIFFLTGSPTKVNLVNVHNSDASINITTYVSAESLS